MPHQSELTILSGDPSKDLDFGSIFNDCLSAFQSNGSYSEISVSDEKFLTKTISLEFCKIVKGTLEDIAQKVRENNIRKTALILVGRFLGKEYKNSKLYDKDFKHEYRG